jgi:hypothetical protein
MYRKYILLFLVLYCSFAATAQLCTTPGQTPVTAKLVCGTESFYMNTPVYCGNTPVPVPCTASGFSYTNKNPNFFRMNCFQSGSLGFTIVPDEATADYNWQLFDITGSNPNDVFTNPGLFVACNWSAEPVKPALLLMVPALLFVMGVACPPSARCRPLLPEGPIC